jgi:hypothetical protein
MVLAWDRYNCPLTLSGNTDPESAFRRSLNKSACHQFNKPCAFLPLCSSPEPERWLGSYEVDRWDPLKAEEEV